MLAGVKMIMHSHGSTILTVAGVAGVVGSGIWACKATVKAVDIKVNMDADIEAVKETGYSSEKSFNKAMRNIYFSYGREFLKVYGPPVLLGAVSIGSILYGHSILNKKNIAMAGAYKLLTTDFDGYRKRVVDRLGEDVERGIHYNMASVTAEDGQGHEKTVEFVPDEYANMVTDRSVFFDESSIYWEDDPEKNKLFLTKLCDRAQEKYDSDGYLLLSWIYDNLDVPVTYASTVCGWVKGYGDDYVDFGMFDIYSAASRRFVNGLEPVILLNFNDHGYILDKI